MCSALLILDKCSPINFFLPCIFVLLFVTI
uniref:Uncharacterized protein n=1 Tax=Rhizophora mucronata TaxID=61149 RepID=A0A2P2Q1P6_RHIMU